MRIRPNQIPRAVGSSVLLERPAFWVGKPTVSFVVRRPAGNHEVVKGSLASTDGMNGAGNILRKRPLLGEVEQGKAHAKMVEQKRAPFRLPPATNPDILERSTCAWALLKHGIDLSAVERAFEISKRRGLARVDEPAGKGFRERQRQYSIAQQPTTTTGWGHERGAFARLPEGFLRVFPPFAAVAIQQPRCSLALQNTCQLPAEVVRVGKPGIETAHPKDRDEVRRVPDEEDTSNAVVVQTEAVRLVEADPVEFPRPWFADEVQLLLDATADVRLVEFHLRIVARLKLVIHAPHAVRLFVHQHR